MKIKIKNSQPLISIIMNCYNGERFLKSAIDSVFSQTYSNWEIIFWDNASTDNSAAIAKSYDSRLKYYCATNTTVLGEARSQATNKTSGKYLAFLDSDDLWEVDKLEKQIQILGDGNGEIGLVYGRAEVVYESLKKSNFVHEKGKVLKSGDIFNELVKCNFITFSSVIVDKDLFLFCGGFPSNFKNSPDYAIFLRMSQKYLVGVVQSVCCKYRIHEGNLSSIQHVISAKESIEVLKSLLPDERVNEGLKHHYVQLTVAYIKEKKIVSAMKLLWFKGGLILLLKRLIKK